MKPRERVSSAERAVPGITRALAWCGEIVGVNVDDAWRMTAEYVRTFAHGEATLVVIDLSRLRAVDAAGVELMVRVKRWAGTLSIQVLYAHPAAAVRTALQVAGVDSLLLEGAQ